MKKLFFLFLTFSSAAQAFNWTRCQSSQPVNGHSSDAFGMTSTTVMNTMVQSSQFSSSWGDCSLIGEAEKVRKTFIAQNLPHLMEDMARGSGEYLEAYAALHECGPEGKKEYGREMKKRFFRINESDFEAVYQQMEGPFPNLKDLCPLT